MWLSIVTREYKVDLIDEVIIYMYCLQKNGLDKFREYISCVVGHGLHLKLLDSTSS